MMTQSVAQPEGYPPAPAEMAGLREQFLLRPEVIFLNHGSFGACPRPVFARYQAWQLELERQPVEFLGRRYPALMAEAREVLGGFLGAPADDLVYVPNATTGLNMVARSLPLAPGDEVLASDHEYPALDRTWEFVCAKRGATYRRQPVPLPISSAAEVVEAIWSGVTPRTRVLFLSHLTAPTALIFPIEELVARARAAKIVTVIDGAHVPGQLALNLQELGADFYSGNLHKWLLAPKGSAFLYVRPEWQSHLQPLVVSLGRSGDAPGRSAFIDEHEYQGTRDIAAYLAVPAAIAFQAEHRWSLVRRYCHELVRLAGQQVRELTKLAPIVPDSPAWFAQMAALPLPPLDGALLKRRLYDEFKIEIPVFVWNDRQFLRLSVQGYNTANDIAALLAALRIVLP